MTELLVAPEREEIVENGCTKTAYDMAMGTSQMLGCLTEHLQDINPDAALTCFGQEFNPETYAIAKADIPAYKVSRRTDYLIVGIRPGSKLVRAREFDVTIIYEQEIEYLLTPKEQHNEDEALQAPSISFYGGNYG